jgi:hypothetical protein
MMMPSRICEKFISGFRAAKPTQKTAPLAYFLSLFQYHMAAGTTGITGLRQSPGDAHKRRPLAVV